MGKSVDIKYQAPPTLWRFHMDDSFVRGVSGPIGSGKSTACCWEIFDRAQKQKTSPDGIRRTRWAIVRNSYRELLDTTVKTWLDWFPEGNLGSVFSETKMLYTAQFNDVAFEVLFRALDRPQDVKKLLSLELTGAWINESREVPKAIVDGIQGRVGRYPSMREGGCTWSGLFMDTNPPTDDSWWYETFEENRPEGWALFKQPGGRDPNAENLKHLPPNYYQRLCAGKSREWIKVYVDGKYGSVMDGKPVYVNQWNDNYHVAPDEFLPIKATPVIVGLDFGLTPAAVFVQVTQMGQVRVIDELVAEDMGIEQFADNVLIPLLNTKYRDIQVEIVGDPAGVARAGTDEQTPFGILIEKDLDAVEAPTNNPQARWEAVRYYLSRMQAGFPAFQLSPHCKQLRRGFNGGYRYKMLNLGGGERYSEKADKNKYSHPHDALQYACSHLRGPGVSRKKHSPIHLSAGYGQY